MSQDHSENGSTPDILGHLEAYERMRNQCERYASLKDNVEKERRSVKLYIYERVKAEYQDKMRALEEDLKEQKELLQESIRDLLDRRSELNKLCRKDTERLEEIEFRTRVGEFTEEECREERNEIEQRTQRQSKELARLEEIVGQCTKSGLLADQQPAPDPAAEPQEAGEASRVEEDRSKEANPPPSPEEETAETSETLETAPAEVAEDFEIVEEDPLADHEDAPVIHCPPKVSSGSPQPHKDSEAGTSQPSPHVEVSEYVTGYLVALEGSRQGERFPMISSNITLGSSPGIDIRLNDSGIANFHARILYKERKHFLENLDTRGRSFVNGVQATDVVELKEGDVIRLGDIKMQVEYAAAQRTPAK